jgi:hypothetical protein
MNRKVFDFVYTVIILVIFIVYFLNILSLRHETGINTGYIDTYLPMMILCILYCFFSIVFQGLKTFKGIPRGLWGIISNLFWITDDDPEGGRIFSQGILPFILIGIFTIAIILVPIVGHVMAYPSPQVAFQEQALQFSSASQTYFMSFPVGFGEDLIYNLMLTNIIVFLLCGLVLLIFKIDARSMMGLFIFIILISSALSGLGYGFAFPGFAGEHRAIYQFDEPSYLVAWGVGSLTAFIFQITGLFLPIAHIGHNLIVSMNIVSVLAIGGLVIKGISLTLFLEEKKKRRKKSFGFKI